jgi:uncharacterized repeat protein (TIGR03806 family)
MRLMFLVRIWVGVAMLGWPVEFLRSAPATPSSVAPYGLTNRGQIKPFLNGSLPDVTPPIPGNWSVIPAFPNLKFTNALGLASVPGTPMLAVWEREGRVYAFTNNPSISNRTLLLDISQQCQGWDDSGLLGLAFHPGFKTNQFVFVYYVWVQPGTVAGSPTARPTAFKRNAYRVRLSRFQANDGGIASTNSETVLVDLQVNSLWHKGGGLFFHPTNGFLYFSNGDDHDGPTQVIDQDLSSGIFRIDVDQRGGQISHPPPRQPQHGHTSNYFIPNDNPFVGKPGVLEEFFALGLRNPHRMTFDPDTGRIFIGDVGAESREEIDVIEPNDPPGLNFQWNKIEGLRGDLAPPYIGINRRPLLDYDRSQGQAVIGGYVYRGTEFGRELGGKYIFGDNVQRKIWSLEQSGAEIRKILLCVLPKGAGPSSGPDYTGLSSFGLDAKNELYLCQLSSEGGHIYKLAKTKNAVPSRDFPKLLSQTGAFADLKTLAPATGLVPYNVNTPLWSDGANKSRWMAIPDRETIGFSPTAEWEFPSGSVLVKHFELPIDERNSASVRRLETRLLIRDTNGGVFGATYKWKQDNSDAELLSDSLNEDIAVQTASGVRTQTWHYPSRDECLQCHTTAARGVLGLNTRQINRKFNYPDSGVSDNQLRAWNHIGLFNPPLDDSMISALPRLVSVMDKTAPLELRVRSYLDANCSQCHRPGGVNSQWDGRMATPLAAAKIIDGPVNQNNGDPAARIVAPGDPEKSLLYQRANSEAEQTRMPPLARNRSDAAAMAVLAEWIRGLRP